MLKVNAEHFCVAAIMLGKAQIWAKLSKEKTVTTLPADDRDITIEALAPLSIAVRDMGAKVSWAATLDLMSNLKTRQGITYADVTAQFAYLEKTLKYELEACQLFALHATKQEYWTQAKPLFGSDVEKRFPAAIDDIVEAGKCLALERGTATVFHLMRVMEAGLKVLAKQLGISYAPSWESYTKQIGDKIAAKHSTKSAKWKKQQPFFRDVLGDLQAVKTAWRNPTMHVVKKYTPEEAEDIYRAVRTFMQRLAGGLPPLPVTKPKGSVFD